MQDLSSPDFAATRVGNENGTNGSVLDDVLATSTGDDNATKERQASNDVMTTVTTTTTTTTTTGRPKKEQYRQQQQQQQSYRFSDECGLYLAPSTLPGAGIGVFLGNRRVDKNDHLLSTGDHTIPIVDRLLFTESEDSPLRSMSHSFLLTQYTWKAESHYVEDLGVDYVTLMSPGIPAAANSFMDFVNVKVLPTRYIIPRNRHHRRRHHHHHHHNSDSDGSDVGSTLFHRRSDPGAGAITYHHTRYVTARRNIQPGEEILLGYGDSWFKSRRHKLGPIPITGDHAKADKLLKKFRAQVQEEQQDFKIHAHSNRTSTRRIITNSNTRVLSNSSDREVLTSTAVQNMWEEFLVEQKRIYGEDSTVLAALPSKEELGAVFQAPSLYDWKLSHLRRDMTWLEEHGVCADNFHMGPSTLPQAGNGAFASRSLRKGSVVLPVPLLHIPDRKILSMFRVDTNATDDDGNRVAKVDFSKPKPPQLLLNYCLGHRDSTMILTSSGTSFHWINHNQTLANVQLRWASPERSQHKPSILEKTVKEITEEVKSASLAMELVALRDIKAGEEIFLDYGDEWQRAWEDHVREWKPPASAASYVSAYEMNRDFPYHLFRTESEQDKEPYPSNLMLKFHKKFQAEKDRTKFLEDHPDPVTEYDSGWQRAYSTECRVLERKKGAGSRILYTIEIYDDNLHSEKVLEDVPQEAIFFQDRPYTSDQFLDNAFRHDIRIPDELFPEAWKNLLEKELKKKNWEQKRSINILQKF